MMSSMLATPLLPVILSLVAACLLLCGAPAQSANLTTTNLKSTAATGTGHKSGPWHPMKPKVSTLVSISPPDAPHYQSTDTIVGTTVGINTRPNSNHNQQQQHQQQHQQQQQQPHQQQQPQQQHHQHHNVLRHSPFAPTAQASSVEPRSFHAGNDEMSGGFPPPMIKHRENGATVGLDLPDSNLRLLLDIDELANKPISENIKFKVIERDQEQGTFHGTNNGNGQSSNNYAAPLRPPQQQRNSISNNNGAGNKPFGGYRIGNVVSAASPIPQYQSGLPSGNQAVSKQYKIGYIRAADLHTVLNRGANPGGKFSAPSGPNSFRPNRPNANYNNGGNANVQASGQFQVKYSQQLPGDTNTNNQQPSNSGDQSYTANGQSAQSPQTAAASPAFSKANVKPPGKAQVPSYPPSPQQRNKSNSKTGKKPPQKEITQQKQSSYDEDTVTEQQQAIKPRGPTDKPSFGAPVQEKFATSDEQQKHVEMTDEDEEIELVKQANDDEGFGNDDRQAELKDATTPSTNGHQGLGSVVKKADKLKNEVEGDFDDDEADDFTIIKPFPPTAGGGGNQDQQRGTCPASACQGSCMPTSRLIAGDMDSLSLREFAEKIGADAIFDMFPSMEDEFQNVADFATSGFTMFLPSNEAMARLPRSLIKSIKSNPDVLKKIVENHVSDEKQTMKEVKSSLTMKPRAASAKLTVTKQRDLSMTVNGQRVVQTNLRGPMGSIVHVLDGLLYPIADKDIMKTLKSCNRFDGFVTLAEGTGIGDKLNGDGPFTVFVPSNEALQKIPDSDLDRIRNNMTSLKEFLMFHVAEGSHYSADLRDGQFIPSMLSGQEIQVGVRVDGCSRRLVEANVSPLYRADIPASNGVIHVVDWILKPNDRDWCDGIVLPRR